MNSTNRSEQQSFCPNELISVYITPSISLVGVVFNLLSTIVFTRMVIQNPKINSLYKILHVKSILELLVFVVNVFMPIYYCKQCAISFSFISQIWFIYFFNYFEDFILTSSLIFEIMAALQCYFNLTSKSQSPQLLCFKSTKWSMLWIVSAVITMTALYSSFIIFRFRITTVGSDPIIYGVERTAYYNTSFDTVVRFLQAFFRDIILVFILLMIQSVLAVFIGRRVKAKQTIANPKQPNSNNQKSLEKCKNKTIMMVIVSGMIYVLGHMPILVYYLPFAKTDKNFWSCFYLFALIPFYFSYLPNLVIYSFFNKIFSRHLKDILGIKPPQGM